MKKTLFIIGPTASGKSSFSVGLAKALQTEIISADSMQIYQGLDIGTAKIQEKEMEGIRHHMLDIVPADASFSARSYQQMADLVIKESHRQNKIPVITGGTGLYLQSLLFELDFGQTKPDPSFRRSLSDLSNETLHGKLREINEDAARKIHPNNRRRVIRMLEIAAAGQIPNRGRFDTPRKDLDAIILGLRIPREILHQRIITRVDQMLADGLIDETRKVLFPLSRRTQAAEAIGYAETIAFLKGLCTKDELRRNIIVHTRQYAKRQMTWFRRLPVRWIPYDTDPARMAEELLQHHE